MKNLCKVRIQYNFDYDKIFTSVIYEIYFVLSFFSVSSENKYSRLKLFEFARGLAVNLPSIGNFEFQQYETLQPKNPGKTRKKE